VADGKIDIAAGLNMEVFWGVSMIRSVFDLLNFIFLEQNYAVKISNINSNREQNFWLLGMLNFVASFNNFLSGLGLT
jgi:hypothetical protein